jgi:predicted porin
MPSAHADVPVSGKLYGRVNLMALGIDSNEQPSVEDSKLTSYFSHIGFDGKRDLNSKVSAFIKLEAEVIIDESASQLKVESIEPAFVYVGLKSHYGSVLFGNTDTPFKKIQNRVDLFNDIDGDIRSMLPGQTFGKQMISYTSLNHRGFVVSTAKVLADEGSDGGFEHLSSSLSYDNKIVTLGLAVDQNVITGSFYKEPLDLVAMTGQIKLDKMQFSLLLQKANEAKGSANYDSDSWVFSSLYQHKNHSFKFQYGQTSAGSISFNSEVEQWSIGLDTQLSAQFKARIFHTSIESVDIKTKKQYTAAGLEYNF